MKDDNLTRAEAEDRAATLSVLSYDVALDLAGDGDTFASTTTVRFQCTEPGPTRSSTSTRPPSGSSPSTASRSPSTPSTPSAAASTCRGLAGRQRARGRGRLRLPAHRRGPAPLRRPHRRQPLPPHPVRALRRPPGLRLLRPARPQGHLRPGRRPPPRAGRSSATARVADADDGGRRGGSRPPAVISTYLVALVAGPYHAVHEEHRGIGTSIYCRESLAQYLDADEIFTVTRQGLDFFEAEFGYPYPFPKYDQLFVPEFNFGAMENPGCVTFNEGYVFRSRVTDAAYEGRAGTILHEMAHMWFGDLVTMRWWDDLWLNESFATYMGNDAVARATRFTDAWVRFASGDKAWALVQDQLPTTHPISADIVDTDAVRLHFDGITYAKGASVLKQLVAWVGKEAFTEGVQRYFRRHEWSQRRAWPTSSARWRRPAAASWSRGPRSGWRRRASTPCGRRSRRDVRALRRLRHRPGGRAAAVAPAGGRPLRPRCRRRRPGPPHAGWSSTWSASRTEVDELLGQAPADLVLLNDDDLTYAKVRLDERSVATLGAPPERHRRPPGPQPVLVVDLGHGARRRAAHPPLRRPGPGPRRGRGRRLHPGPAAGPGQQRGRRLRRPGQPAGGPGRAGGPGPAPARPGRARLRPPADLGPPPAGRGRVGRRPRLRPGPARRHGRGRRA